jgi:hypothetical protein
MSALWARIQDVGYHVWEPADMGYRALCGLTANGKLITKGTDLDANKNHGVCAICFIIAPARPTWWADRDKPYAHCSTQVSFLE